MLISLPQVPSYYTNRAFAYIKTEGAVGRGSSKSVLNTILCAVIPWVVVLQRAASSAKAYIFYLFLFP